MAHIIRRHMIWLLFVDYVSQCLHDILPKVFWPPRDNIFYDVVELNWSKILFPFTIKIQRQFWIEFWMLGSNFFLNSFFLSSFRQKWTDRPGGYRRTNRRNITIIKYRSVIDMIYFNIWPSVCLVLVS